MYYFLFCCRLCYFAFAGKKNSNFFLFKNLIFIIKICLTLIKLQVIKFANNKKKSHQQILRQYSYVHEHLFLFISSFKACEIQNMHYEIFMVYKHFF